MKKVSCKGVWNNEYAIYFIDSLKPFKYVRTNLFGNTLYTCILVKLVRKRGNASKSKIIVCKQKFYVVCTFYRYCLLYLRNSSTMSFNSNIELCAL